MIAEKLTDRRLIDQFCGLVVAILPVFDHPLGTQELRGRLSSEMPSNHLGVVDSPVYSTIVKDRTSLRNSREQGSFLLEVTQNAVVHERGCSNGFHEERRWSICGFYFGQVMPQDITPIYDDVDSHERTSAQMWMTIGERKLHARSSVVEWRQTAVIIEHQRSRLNECFRIYGPPETNNNVWTTVIHQLQRRSRIDIDSPMN